MTHTWSRSPTCVFIGLFVPLLLAAQEKTKWEQDFQDGAQAFADGHYARAVEALTSALQDAEAFSPLDLRRSDGLHLLAMSYQFQGKFDRAEPLFIEARGIVEALPMTILAGKPVFLVLDGDIAQSLGALLKEEWGVASEVLVIDGISLWDFDYVDLGRVRMPSYTVPVTIKSLVFSEDPRGPRSRAHGHAHEHGHEHGHGHHHHQHSP